MHPLIKKILFSAMALIFLLSACVPSQPTQSPQDVQNQVATIVALTVAAQNAQTQAAQPPTPAATNTVLPTQTESFPSPTPLIPTVTPIVLPTKASGGGGGGGSVLSTEYDCDSIRRRPFDNTIFRPDKTFDIKWTIVNTGSKTLKAGLDLKYNSGTKLTSTTIVELPELKPGAQYQVDFDATAPHKEGTYIMTFVVEGGLCYPYTAIVVQK
ncbi:MAG TPA: NBR1-Ig-like domain-containing protein [Anaerolineales bacterium]|nr:NBR1-Ig-like domain-containing protein [Anaerolineales bacterium]